MINDDSKSAQIKVYLENGNNPFLEEKYNKALVYSKKLTLNPSEIEEKDIKELRKEGLTDGEILEINQVVLS